MSKYVLFGLIITFIISITLLANAVETYDSNFNSGIGTGDLQIELPEEKEASNILRAFNTVFTMAKTWFKLATFTMTGFPAWISLILFLPLNFMAVYMLIDIIRGSG